MDEEGGSITRIASNENFDVETFPDLAEISDENTAYSVGAGIGKYLKEYGFNLDFAPVADVAGQNSAIGRRSFGADVDTVKTLSWQMASGIEDNGVFACVKHFPGFGRATENTDFADAAINVTADELKKTDLVPFENAMTSGISFVMVGNMSFPKITGDDKVASMSKEIVDAMVRGEYSYDGVLITDAYSAKAVTNRMKSGEAAVNAIEAGMDIILMPEDFDSAYNSVINAVKDGTITEERIDESVKRILKLKGRLEE